MSATKYSKGEAPRKGDIVHPVGDWSGLLWCRYQVLAVSRFSNGPTFVCARPLIDSGAERERKQPVDVCVGRFKLIQRGAKS